MYFSIFDDLIKFAPSSPLMVSNYVLHYFHHYVSPITFSNISSNVFPCFSPNFIAMFLQTINSPTNLHYLMSPHYAIHQLSMHIIANIHSTPHANQPCFYTCHPEAALILASSYACMSHALCYVESAAAP